MMLERGKRTITAQSTVELRVATVHFVVTETCKLPLAQVVPLILINSVWLVSWSRCACTHRHRDRFNSRGGCGRSSQSLSRHLSRQAMEKCTWHRHHVCVEIWPRAGRNSDGHCRSRFIQGRGLMALSAKYLSAAYVDAIFVDFEMT